MSTKQYTCQCGDTFTARTADRKRGWARFCSKSCKAIEQEGRTGTYREYMQRAEQSDRDAGRAANEAGWDGHKNVF